ncbi:AMP-binding protein, partial [Pseudomonas shirazensis]
MTGIDNVMNLGELLAQIARRLPDAPGFIRGADSYSWQQLLTRVDSVAAALRERGLGKGDKLLVHSRNNLQLFESAWVAFRLGMVWVPTNVRITPPEAAYLGSSSGAVAMLYDDGMAAYVDAVREASPALRMVIAIGAPRDGELSYDALLDQGAPLQPAFRPAEVSYHDPLWFFYTSGTTGHPKAGILTHGQMAFVINNHLADLMPGLSPHSRSLVLAPLSHGAGI